MLERLRGLIPRRIEASEPGGLPFSALYPSRPAQLLAQRSYSPIRSVPASTSSQVLADANPSRRSLTIVNDSSANLYLALGPVASSAGYSILLGPSQTGVLEDPDVYQGVVAGVWSAAAGAARITETTR
jgi:hypothetical protein